MADVFVNLANFVQHTLLTLAPPSGYILNLKALINASKVCWASQFSYIVLWSSFERKFRKDSRECIRTDAVGARTRRSLGFHPLHPQNIDRFHYCFSLLEIEEKRIFGKESSSNTCLFTLKSQSCKTVTIFSFVTYLCM